jgi:hypothetical protein
MCTGQDWRLRRPGLYCTGQARLVTAPLRPPWTCTSRPLSRADNVGCALLQPKLQHAEPGVASWPGQRRASPSAQRRRTARGRGPASATGSTERRRDGRHSRAALGSITRRRARHASCLSRAASHETRADTASTVHRQVSFYHLPLHFRLPIHGQHGSAVGALCANFRPAPARKHGCSPLAWGPEHRARRSTRRLAQLGISHLLRA